jgi:hypothetical protein
MSRTWFMGPKRASFMKKRQRDVGPVDARSSYQREVAGLPPTRGDSAMRVIVLVKATSESEAGIMPSTELLEAMGRYNEQLANVGILLAGEGLPAVVEG